MMIELKSEIETLTRQGEREKGDAKLREKNLFRNSGHDDIAISEWVILFDVEFYLHDNNNNNFIPLLLHYRIPQLCGGVVTEMRETITTKNQSYLTFGFKLKCCDMQINLSESKNEFICNKIWGRKTKN
jgi:hypothetical protein